MGTLSREESKLGRGGLRGSSGIEEKSELMFGLGPSSVSVLVSLIRFAIVKDRFRGFS